MVLVNLKPAKLAGVLSEGMPSLCQKMQEGNLALMTPEKSNAGRSRDLLIECKTLKIGDWKM